MTVEAAANHPRLYPHVWYAYPLVYRYSLPFRTTRKKTILVWVALVVHAMILSVRVAFWNFSTEPV